jgi:ZIP family zinc transporter
LRRRELGERRAEPALRFEFDPAQAVEHRFAVDGVIGGGPTFLGTVIGQSFVNETVDMMFLALAAGSILYVIVQLLNVALKLGHREMLMWGLFVGLVFGLGTELVLVAAGL